MQSKWRALVYPVIAWWLWMGLVMLAYLWVKSGAMTLTDYALLKAALSAVLTITFTVLYLRHIEQGSWREGLAVGLTALAITIVFDIGHNLMMGLGVSATYFTHTAPFYLVIPFITTLVLGCLRKQ